MKRIITLQTIANRIKRNNAKFEAMSPADKRVAVAKDLIDRVHVKQLAASTGHPYLGLKANDNTSLKDKLSSEDFVCKVCAKGGLLLAYVGRVNQITPRDLLLSDDAVTEGCNDPRALLHTKLSEIFSYEQISLIESAFEGGQYLMKDLDGHEITLDKEKYQAFYDKYEYDEDERLIAIAKNIIKNKGTFKP